MAAGARCCSICPTSCAASADPHSSPPTVRCMIGPTRLSTPNAVISTSWGRLALTSTRATDVVADERSPGRRAAPWDPTPPRHLFGACPKLRVRPGGKLV